MCVLSPVKSFTLTMLTWLKTPPPAVFQNKITFQNYFFVSLRQWPINMTNIRAWRVPPVMWQKQKTDSMGDCCKRYNVNCLIVKLAHASWNARSQYQGPQYVCLWLRGRLKSKAVQEKRLELGSELTHQIYTEVRNARSCWNLCGDVISTFPGTTWAGSTGGARQSSSCCNMAWLVTWLFF